jgi:hypothetical protein
LGASYGNVKNARRSGSYFIGPAQRAGFDAAELRLRPSEAELDVLHEQFPPLRELSALIGRT